MSSSHTTEQLTEQLVKVYANYAKVDWENEIKDIRDIIENIMIRLEEVQSIVLMVKNLYPEHEQQYFLKLQNYMDRITSLSKRVNALHDIITMVDMNLCSLEAAMDKAEAELGISDRLFGIPNPLSFFKKTQEPVVSNTAMPMYKLPVIYKSDDYFQKE